MLDSFIVPSAHHDELRRLRRFRAAKYGRGHELLSRSRVLSGQFLAQVDTDGAKRNMKMAGRERAQNSAITECHGLHRDVISQHGQHRVAAASFSHRGRHVCSIPPQHFCTFASAVVHGDAMSSAKKTSRDSGTHIAKANKSYVHASLLPEPQEFIRCASILTPRDASLSIWNPSKTVASHCLAGVVFYCGQTVSTRGVML
jgi:hypothetical protein